MAIVVDAKVSSGDLLLTGENDVALLTKFAVSAGKPGSFQVQFKIDTKKGMYTDERQLKVSLFKDEAKSWSAQKKFTLCHEKLRFAKNSYPVVFDSKMIDGTSYWVADVSAQLPESDSAMYWYVTLNDCLLEQSYHSIKDAPEMEYSFTVLNGDSHVSADEMGMGKLHVFQIASSSLLLLLVVFKIIKGMVSPSSKSQIHVALLMVSFATACDIASGVFELIHSGVYAMNGLGSYSFDCLASHFEAQCDAMVALVLLLVSAGWTMPSDVVVASNQNSAMMGMSTWLQKIVSGFRSPIAALGDLKRGSPNPAALLVLSIIVFHAFLAQWGRTFDDDFDSYHSLEHLPGRVLMRFRLVLGLMFLIASSSVRNSGRVPSTLQPFLKKFQMVGISWFLSLPFIAMYVSAAMHSHQKHFALSVGAMLAQSCSLASLCWLFMANKDASAYHRMSTVRKGNDSLSSGSGMGKPGSNFWKIGKTKICLD